MTSKELTGIVYSGNIGKYHTYNHIALKPKARCIIYVV